MRDLLSKQKYTVRFKKERRFGVKFDIRREFGYNTVVVSGRSLTKRDDRVLYHHNRRCDEVA